MQSIDSHLHDDKFPVSQKPHGFVVVDRFLCSLAFNVVCHNSDDKRRKKLFENGENLKNGNLSFSA